MLCFVGWIILTWDFVFIYLLVWMGNNRKSCEFSGFSFVERQAYFAMGVWSKNPRPIIKIPVKEDPALQIYPAFADLLKFVEALEYEAAFGNQAIFFFCLGSKQEHQYTNPLPDRILIYNFTQIWAFCYLSIFLPLSLKADDMVHPACIEVNLIFLPSFLLELCREVMIMMIFMV